jgi:3,4-dihydroxy 2-butanone 4-phosphate synthase/GTP cyclohydrolase II
MGDWSPAATVQSAAAALAAGGLVVVVDDADRENEADLLGAAELMTDEQMAFLVRHTTGIVCTPMSAERCAALQLPQMVEHNTDAHGTAFTVSVDHVDAGTGVSAAARARTVRALADGGTRPEQLRRPGHIFPLRARDGGTLVRAGHTEAALDLLAIAGLTQVGVISELIATDGAMLHGDEASGSRSSTGCRWSPSRISCDIAGVPSDWRSRSHRRRCPRRSASSAPWPTATARMAPNTSRW